MFAEPGPQLLSRMRSAHSCARHVRRRHACAQIACSSEVPAGDPLIAHTSVVHLTPYAKRCLSVGAHMSPIIGPLRLSGEGCFTLGEISRGGGEVEF